MDPHDPLADFEDIPEPTPIEELGPDQIGKVEALIEDLILAVHEARSTIGGHVRLDRDALLSGLEQVKDGIPEELRVARWMIRERQAFIGRTNEEADEIRHQAHKVLEQARAKAKELVSEHAILAEAVEEANILVRNAEVQAQAVRLHAEDRAIEQLGRVDHLFTSALREIREELSELKQARDPGPPAQGT
jgi:DNA repair exonuclease SbcCD ATPase subunit